MHFVNRCRRLAAAALMLIGVLASSQVNAQQRAEDGARIRVEMNWGDDYQGSLVSWSTDSLIVHPVNWSEPVRLPTSGLKSVQRSLGSGSASTTLRHGAYGTLAGLAFGLIVGEYDARNDNRDGRSSRGIVLTATGVGMLLGLINGFTTEIWQPVFPTR